MALVAFASIFIPLFIVLIAAIIFVAAAVNDAQSYRIPNCLCVLLFLLFPAYALTSQYAVDWRQNVLVFVLVSLVGFAAFLGNFMGAGDIKLLSAASFWAGPHFIAVLLIVTAFAGGIEALVMMIALHRTLPKTNKIRRLAKAQIPYGIAIATGGLTMLWLIAPPILLPV
jgi:prepilin peptidase CpaA